MISTTRVIVIILAACKCNEIVPMPMINSLITHSGTSRVISAFFCQRKDGINMLRYFAQQLQQINILSPNMDKIPSSLQSTWTTFVLNLDCPGAKNLLLRANDDKLFGDPFKWIINDNNGLSIQEIINNYFNKLEILVDSDVTVAIRDEDAFIIKKIYQRYVNTSILIEDVGNWTLGEGFTVNGYEQISYKRRRNLMRTVLKTCIVVTNNDTLNHLTDKRDKHIDSLAKVNYVLVQHLADTVNAELSYSIRSTWGYKDNNSNWSGMMGELTRKEADIGGTALFVTSDRISVVDYIAMPTPTRSNFIFRQPKLSYTSNLFTLPFSRAVWISIVGLLIIITIVLYIVVGWEWKKKIFVPLENESNENEIHLSWSEITLVTFSALCQQGASNIPFSLPGRITLIFLLVSFMFLYTSYSANIVALLQSSSSNIQTLEDLLHSRLDLGVDDTVYLHFYFTTATEPVRKQIYLQKIAPPGQKPRFYPIEEGIKRVREGLFAFFVEKGPGYKLISETFQESEKCGLQGIPYLEVPDPWLAIQKKSSFKKMLKVGLRLLQESGIQAREVGLIYTKKPECLARGSSFVSVGLVDCYPVAVVLVTGMLVSIVILLLEIFVNMRYQCNSKKLHNIRCSAPRRANIPYPYVN